jgi:ribonuclease BN (tRNA processing enzyme)
VGLSPSLTILGCTGSYPAAGTACSGYLLRAGDEVVMLDAGPGTLANLQRHVDLDQLTGVVLSHHHPDHWTDFGVLRTAWHYGLGLEGLRVFGTADTLAIAEHMFGHSLDPVIAWEVVGDGHEAALGAMKLQFSRTEHYVETMAVRLDLDGWSFAFSGDTGPGWSVAALGEGITAFLCEATLLDHERATSDHDVLHLTAREAGVMARDAGVGQLLLTHQPPGATLDLFADEARAAFGAPVEVVREGATYPVAFGGAGLAG